MRIGIQTWGSEGDTRPFLALGHALASRGHQVELIYTEISERNYEAAARALGFTARSVATPVMTDEELYAVGLKMLATGDPLRQGLLIARTAFEPVVEPIYEAALALAKRSDLLVHHFILHPTRAAADLTGTPAVSVALAHMLIPSREIHPQGTPHLGTWGNIVLWKIARLAMNLTLGRDANRFRARVGLPPFRDLADNGWASKRLHLIASSPALLNRPADWPPNYHLCGVLELPPHQHETMPAELEAFLAAGPPPVFMGFGSLMPMGGSAHLEESVAVFREAARMAGQRAIIHAEIEDAPARADVLFVGRTPHAQLFPRCAAVVHHAGAGTTHTTLRAGVPSVPVPHISDQFAWAEELERLGVAPPYLRRYKWSAVALADRIRHTVGNAGMKAAALAIQQRMAADDGPATAARLIEDVMR